MANAYTPIGIQRQAHKAMLVDGYTRALLYWSRRCFVAGTLVSTEYGDIEIENIRKGIRVWARDKDKPVLKVVEETHKFGLGSHPKPMIQCVLNGREIYATYDHEFRIGQQWVPLYILTWRTLAPRYRALLELLCKQSGTPLDYEQIRQSINRFDASGDRRLWLLTNGNGRSYDKSPSSSSTDLVGKSIQQADSESYRQQSAEQSSGQLRVGDSRRERGSYDGPGTTDPQLRGEMRDTQIDGSASFGNNEISGTSSRDVQTSNVEKIGREISDQVREYTPYFERPHLEVQSAIVTWGQVTYDLSVADVHNYTANGINCHNTGKTLWSIQHLMLAAIIRQGPYHIVFKEYQQAETVAWNQYLHTIPENLIARLDKSTLTIYFNYFDGVVKLPAPIGEVIVKADTSKPASSIRLLGSDKADAHRGGESLGMIFDEYQDQDTYGWDYVYKYFFATTNGWAAFLGTAKESDHWNEMLDKAQALDNWYYSKATWRENPLIKPEWIAQERLEAELEHRLGPFLQETELIPFSQQGSVYPMFNKDIHVIKPMEIPDRGTEYIFLDFGFAEGHPMAACFVRITRDDIWYQWDEIHDTGIQIDDLIAEIRTKMGDRMLTAIIADSARPDLIDYMQSKGLPVIPAPKKQNSVASGIQLFAKRLRPKIQVIGVPRPNYYVGSNCKKTIYDFVHYRYKEVKENRHPMENPEKRYDDAMDALRYGELYFKFGAKDTEKPIPKSVSFGNYGLL